MDSLVKSTSVATVKGVVVLFGGGITAVSIQASQPIWKQEGSGTDMGVPVGLIPRRRMSPLGAPPGWYFQVMSSPAALVQTVEAVGDVK